MKKLGKLCLLIVFPLVCIVGCQATLWDESDDNNQSDKDKPQYASVETQAQKIIRLTKKIKILEETIAELEAFPSRLSYLGAIISIPAIIALFVFGLKKTATICLVAPFGFTGLPFIHKYLLQFHNQYSEYIMIVSVGIICLSLIIGFIAVIWTAWNHRGKLLNAEAAAKLATSEIENLADSVDSHVSRADRLLKEQISKADPNNIIDKYI